MRSQEQQIIIVTLVLRTMGEELAGYRCSKCAAQNAHECCETPDWQNIGLRILERLNG